MYVLLDSNIYCADWFAKSASFRYLIHFLNNEGHTLLLPQVVVEEVPNVRNRKFFEETVAVSKAIKALYSLNGRPVGTDFLSPPAEAYDLLKLMKQQVDEVEVLKYDAISHKEVLDRALRVKRPFRQGEKGYRDTLIWLSLVEFIKSQGKSLEIYFISGNRADFFADNDPLVFHPDLTLDLQAFPHAKVTPVLSISSFVDTHVDQKAHVIDRVNLRPKFEEFLEEQALSIIVSSQAGINETLWRRLVPGLPLFDDLQGVSAEVMEGVEDFKILVTDDMGDGDVYISCLHDLRIVMIQFFVLRRDYETHLDVIEQSGSFYEVEELGKTILLKTSVRVYITATFTYNTKAEACDGYSLSTIDFR